MTSPNRLHPGDPQNWLNLARHAWVRMQSDNEEGRKRARFIYLGALAAHKENRAHAFRHGTQHYDTRAAYHTGLGVAPFVDAAQFFAAGQSLLRLARPSPDAPPPRNAMATAYFARGRQLLENGVMILGQSAQAIRPRPGTILTIVEEETGGIAAPMRRILDAHLRAPRLCR